jgi:hypothetical protein
MGLLKALKGERIYLSFLQAGLRWQNVSGLTRRRY